MQTSNHENRVKRVLKWITVLVVAAVINWLICMALVPYGSKSEVMWTEYRQSDHLDLVFLGTSLVERSVNPNKIDDELGTSSLNMATPSQTLEDTYLGIEQAIKDHKIKRAVVGLELADLNRKTEQKTGVFVREKTKGENPAEILHDWMTSIDGDTWLWSPQAFSILFFPWQIQHVKAQDVLRNVMMRVDGTSVYDAARTNEPGWDYYGKGFGGYTGVYDYVVKPSTYYVNYGKLKGVTEFNDERMQVLERICDLCNENDVELILFVDPLADFHIVSFGDNYQTLSDAIKDFASEHGVLYFDFNLAKPELFENSQTYYQDYQHMNIDGANALSESIATLLRMIDSGESTDDLFCTYAERSARVDTVVSACFTSITSTANAIEMKATSVAGPGVKAEYRFSVLDDVNGGGYVVAQDWSTSSKCTYAPPKKGKYKCKLEVRAKGEEDPRIETTQTIAF